MTDGVDPRSDGVAYRWSLWRFMVAMAALGLIGAIIGWLLLVLLFSALGGRWSFGPGPGGALFAWVYPLAFAACSVLLVRGRPAWLRFGPEGVQLAAVRRDAILIGYGAVSKARVRWPWPLTVIEVFVAAADATQVARLSRGGLPPLRRRQGDQVRYSMPTAGLRASAATIRSELRARGLAA